MKRFCPLPDTHPEFSILDDVASREYRVENWRLARNGSGKVIQGISRFTGYDAFALAVIAVLWWQVLYERLVLNRRYLILPQVRGMWSWLGIGVLCALHVWFRCTQVLYGAVRIGTVISGDLNSAQSLLSSYHRMVSNSKHTGESCPFVCSRTVASFAPTPYRIWSSMKLYDTGTSVFTS